MSERNGSSGETLRYGPDGDAPLIFDRPEFQEGRQRWLFWALTLAAWFVWAYLWLPVVTLLGWYLGFRTFVREIVIPDPRTMLSSGIVYLGIVALIGLVLIGWSRYNLRRFGGEDRRRAPGAVADEEIRVWFGLAPDTLELLRSGRTLVVEYDEEGVLRRARHSAPSLASPRISGGEREPVPLGTDRVALN